MCGTRDGCRGPAKRLKAKTPGRAPGPRTELEQVARARGRGQVSGLRVWIRSLQPDPGPRPPVRGETPGAMARGQVKAPAPGTVSHLRDHFLNSYKKS